MLKKKMIAMAAAALGLAACEPLPVYPPGNGPRLRERMDRDSRYFGNQRLDGPFRRDNPRDDPDSGYYGPRRDLPPVDRQPTRDEYPTAERTNNPNQVLSPYPPYNVIDVEGFRSGQLAKDPSNGKIFRVP